MGDHRLFANFSTEELEQEIKRRKATRPIPRSDIDWNPVRNVILFITRCIEFDGSPPKDFEETVFRAAMNAVYGIDVWGEWWNLQMKSR